MTGPRRDGEIDRPMPRVPLRFMLALAAGLTVSAGAVDADAGTRGRAPWCGNLSGHSLDDCNYFSFEQCRVSVRGLGGFCAPNSAAPPEREIRRPRRERHPYR